MPILYNLRRTAIGFLMAKFDTDFNVEAVYELAPTGAYDAPLNQTRGFTCTCPASARPSCKHRKMLHLMIPKADTDEFYCYETQHWHKPLAPPDEVPMAEKLETFYGALADAVGPDPVPTTDPSPSHKPWRRI